MEKNKSDGGLYFVIVPKVTFLQFFLCNAIYFYVELRKEYAILNNHFPDFSQPRLWHCKKDSNEIEPIKWHMGAGETRNGRNITA